MITEALRDEIFWIINMAWDSLVEFSTSGWATRLGLKDSSECWVCIEHWTSRGHNRFSRDDREQTSILPVTCIVDACAWTPQDDLYLVAPSSLFAWMNFGTFHVDFNSMPCRLAVGSIYMYVHLDLLTTACMPIEKINCTIEIWGKHMERHCRQRPVRVATFNFKITWREALQKNLGDKTLHVLYYRVVW